MALNLRHQEPPLGPDDAKRFIAAMMACHDTGRPQSPIDCVTPPQSLQGHRIGWG